MTLEGWIIIGALVVGIVGGTIWWAKSRSSRTNSDWGSDA